MTLEDMDALIFYIELQKKVSCFTISQIVKLSKILRDQKKKINEDLLLILRGAKNVCYLHKKKCAKILFVKIYLCNQFFLIIFLVTELYCFEGSKEGGLYIYFL